jgi:hypothetical protein
MSDEELRKFGKAARYMVAPTANMGKPPLPTFVLQLKELVLIGAGDIRAPDPLDVTGERVGCTDSGECCRPEYRVRSAAAVLR